MNVSCPHCNKTLTIQASLLAQVSPPKPKAVADYVVRVRGEAPYVVCKQSDEWASGMRGHEEELSLFEIPGTRYEVLS